MTQTAAQRLLHALKVAGINIDKENIDYILEMEKEQIIESYSAGVMAQFDLSIETGEHYYNKNFKINGN
jgi:uncharacterized protein (DUF2164 family)